LDELLRLFPLLDIVTLEVGNWDTVASNIIVHDDIVISASWLSYLLGNLVVNYLGIYFWLVDNSILINNGLSLSTIDTRNFILLLLLKELDSLKLLLELSSLSIDIFIKSLLILVQLINNVLLVQLSLRSSSHRCIINFGS
jgi:hypothetical protein